MAFEFRSGVRYRMPVVFGPTPGPRQHPEGRPWTREEAGLMNAEWMKVGYRTEASALESLLPPGFTLRGEPIVSVSCAWFKNLYWLAGRGYGILSVDFPVSYEGKTERHDGAFCVVLWEGQPEAITTGREELGFPKLYADFAEIERDEAAGTATCQASWFGHKFFEISLGEMVEEIGAEKKLPGSGGGAQLYYKYMPRTSPGGSEGADVASVTTAAPRPGAASGAQNINFDEFEFRKWNAKGSLKWNRATFEQLPLSFHIVNGMADLPILEFVDAEMVVFSGPGIGVSVNSMRTIEPAEPITFA